MVQVLQTWLFCCFIIWIVSLFGLQQTKMSWDRKGLGEKETWGQKNTYKGELTSEAKAEAES